MPEIATRDPRKKISVTMENIYSLAAKERKISEEMNLSLEDISMRDVRGTVGEGEAVRPKDQREKKDQVHDAKTLGIKIYFSKTNSFTERVTFEEMVEVIKRGKYKLTYTEKRTESEVMAMIVRRTVKITQEELKTVLDDVFRKI